MPIKPVKLDHIRKVVEAMKSEVEAVPVTRYGRINKTVVMNDSKMQPETKLFLLSRFEESTWLQPQFSPRSVVEMLDGSVNALAKADRNGSGTVSFTEVVRHANSVSRELWLLASTSADEET